MCDTEVKLTDMELRFKYTATHDNCALCGIPDVETKHRRWPNGLQLAHILGGPNRSNTEANILLLCETCHRAHHNDSVYDNAGLSWHNVTTDVLLKAKQELGELDVGALAKIWGVTEGYVEDRIASEIPTFFIDKRTRWNWNPTCS